jgi:hypothetical protein
MKYKLLLKTPPETQTYGYVTGTCEIYKPAYSNDAIITNNPTFKDISTNETLTFDDKFIGLDPNILEVTSETVLYGRPMFNNECREVITFNAWYTKV